MCNLDEKLMKFECIPCYAEGKHSFISEEFLQFPRGTRRHKVMQWFADEYKREIMRSGGRLL